MVEVLEDLSAGAGAGECAATLGCLYLELRNESDDESALLSNSTYHCQAGDGMGKGLRFVWFFSIVETATFPVLLEALRRALR